MTSAEYRTLKAKFRELANAAGDDPEALKDLSWFLRYNLDLVSTVLDELDANARRILALEDLIESVELAEYGRACPWCEGPPGTSNMDRAHGRAVHEPNCPAFSRPGRLRK